MRFAHQRGWLQRTPLFIAVLLVSFNAIADERRPEAAIHPRVDSEAHRPPLAYAVSPFSLLAEEYAPADTSLDLDLPTHIFFYSGYEIISEVVHDRLSFRQEGGPAEWSVSPIAVNGPHAVTYNFNDSRFYAADTENHRLISFLDPTEEHVESALSVGDIDLNRPHDVVFDQANGFLYLINPQPTILFRMTTLGNLESALDLTDLTGYSRGLTVVDGTVFIASSARGEVIEVVDFESGEVVIHPSFGKLVNANAGSWDTTGFIVNDVEFYDGYWYLSNFFSPHYANGTDHNLFKLVRFRTWDDLANGSWEELSHLVGDGQVPYFFTLHRGSLYMAAFHGNGVQDAVYRFTSGLFFDGFESGDLETWN